MRREGWWRGGGRRSMEIEGSMERWGREEDGGDGDWLVSGTIE